MKQKLYQYSLFWFDPVQDEEIFLGDHFSKEDAEKEVKTWCEECTAPAAKNPDFYIIREFAE